MRALRVPKPKPAPSLVLGTRGGAESPTPCENTLLPLLLACSTPARVCLRPGPAEGEGGVGQLLALSPGAGTGLWFDGTAVSMQAIRRLMLFSCSSTLSSCSCMGAFFSLAGWEG